MEPIAFSRPFYGEAEARAVADVVRSHWIVGGPRQAELERRFAEYCGVDHAVAVSSWTAGGFLLLHAWGIGPGDEVIVPSLTFIASVNVVRHVGATPVFVDIDPRTWNLDPTDVTRRITPRTKLIIAVDQIGLPCDIDAINALAAQHGIRVLQDAACSFASRSHGRPVGSLTETSAFSLHARKVVTTGEGGMIVTRDGALADRLRRLRHQGMSLSDFARHASSPTTFESYPEIGYNFRLTDLQAALGVVQLDHLDEMLARRRTVAERYLEHLEEHPLFVAPFVPEGLEPNWQSFQVSVRPGAPLTRNAVMDALYARGIPTRRGVMASHLEAPYADAKVSLPHTEWAAASCLQLPMHPAVDDDQIDFILGALDEIVSVAKV